jgi:hypothetical protein
VSSKITRSQYEAPSHEKISVPLQYDDQLYDMSMTWYTCMPMLPISWDDLPPIDGNKHALLSSDSNAGSSIHSSDDEPEEVNDSDGDLV